MRSRERKKVEVIKQSLLLVAKRTLPSMNQSRDLVAVDIFRDPGRWLACAWIRPEGKVSRRGRARLRDVLVEAIENERARLNLHVRIALLVMPEPALFLSGPSTQPERRRRAAIAILSYSRECDGLVSELKKVERIIHTDEMRHEPICRYALLLAVEIKKHQAQLKNSITDLIKRYRERLVALEKQAGAAVHGTAVSADPDREVLTDLMKEADEDSCSIDHHMSLLRHKIDDEIETSRNNASAHRLKDTSGRPLLIADVLRLERRLTPKSINEWLKIIVQVQSEITRLLSKYGFNQDPRFFSLFEDLYLPKSWQKNVKLRLRSEL